MYAVTSTYRTLHARVMSSSIWSCQQYLVKSTIICIRQFCPYFVFACVTIRGSAFMAAKLLEDSKPDFPDPNSLDGLGRTSVWHIFDCALRHITVYLYATELPVSSWRHLYLLSHELCRTVCTMKPASAHTFNRKMFAPLNFITEILGSKSSEEEISEHTQNLFYNPIFLKNT
jgi:hypothetical protein